MRHVNPPFPQRGALRIRPILRLLILGIFCAALAVVAINAWMIFTAQRRIVHDVAQLPINDVALVLGTAPKLAGGKFKNPFFENRMDAAAELYHAGKARHILVSGDNRRKNYDEPTAMRDALMARGLPASALTLDYAGFRTLDSLARAKVVFQLTRLTIVTDEFHQPRALFLAQSSGLDAVGFPSRAVPFQWAKKTLVRELGSRVKAWLDVYILRTGPRFYGPALPITVTSPPVPSRSP